MKNARIIPLILQGRRKIAARLNTYSKRQKIFIWTASAFALLLTPAAGLAWSMGSSHVSNNETSISKTRLKIYDSPGTSENNSNVLPEPPSQEPTEATANNNTTKTQNNSSTQVTINDHSITIPSNGSTNQTIVGNNGQTIHLSVQNTSSASGSHNNHSTNLSINSSSSTSSSEMDSQ